MPVPTVGSLVQQLATEIADTGAATKQYTKHVESVNCGVSSQLQILKRTRQKQYTVVIYMGRGVVHE